jgi:hypothetical protein
MTSNMTTNTESPSPGFYKQLTALDRNAHAGLKLKPISDLSAAADLLLVPLVSAEFFSASREYPIVFVRDARQTLMAVAVVGTPNGRNLFVDAQGHWPANYIPAYVRNYPFAFARSVPDALTICFDENCTALNLAEGEPLFAAGEPTPLLQRVIDYLHEYEGHAQFTLSFAQRLADAGLLIDADARADLQGESFSVQGFQMVDEARLRALPEATVKQWFASGELGLIYAHLISLANFLQLLQRQAVITNASAAAASA